MKGSEDIKVSATVGKPCLFDARLLRDWVFLVGAGLAFIGAMGSGMDYAGLTSLTGRDIVAMSVDAGFAALITFGLFGVLPATIRRRSRLRRGVGPSGGSAQASEIVGYVLIAGVLGALVGSLSTQDQGTGSNVVNRTTSPPSSTAISDWQLAPGSTTQRSSSSEPVLSDSRCEQGDGAQLCVTATELTDWSVRLETSFDYDPPRAIDGLQVSNLTWTSVVDCRARTGTLESLVAQDTEGRRLTLTAMSMDAMSTGIEDDQLPPLVERTCR